jgi:hypothetical protein
VHIYIYIHILHNLEKLVGENKFKKLGQQIMPGAKEIFPRAILDMGAIGSSALV